MYFCYLIESINEKYKGDTYIGFAVDPTRRLREHNGEIKGGAKKTSKKRPWNLVIVISNFPNKILALQFEWAWQNPFQSKFLQKNIGVLNENLSKKSKKKIFLQTDFKFKVLKLLICSNLFEKIDLSLYIFKEKSLMEDFSMIPSLKLIYTNSIEFKHQVKNKISFKSEKEFILDIDMLENVQDKCLICELNYDESDFIDKIKLAQLVRCFSCSTFYHICCLAEVSLADSLELIPKSTICLVCGRNYYWNEMINCENKI